MQNEHLDQEHAEIVEQGALDHPSADETPIPKVLGAAGSDFSNMVEVTGSTEKTKPREATDMAGSLFKNDRKSKDTHPDLTGSAMINGVEFYLSAWRKNGAKGDFYSLSVRPKESTAAAKELI